MKTIRIFISSPGDVAEQRTRARQVVQGLRKRYAQFFELKPILWEEMALELGLAFQQGIDAKLTVRLNIDIAVFILWSRLGSPVGAGILREDDSEYRSGTERELDLMMRARQESGGARPRILAYTLGLRLLRCQLHALTGDPGTGKRALRQYRATITNHWHRQIADCLLGDADPDALLTSLATKRPETLTLAVALGLQAEARNDKSRALHYYRTALDTGQQNWLEYTFAKSRREALDKNR